MLALKFVEIGATQFILFTMTVVGMATAIAIMKRGN
jgi:hypothetical protein